MLKTLNEASSSVLLSSKGSIRAFLRHRIATISMDSNVGVSRSALSILVTHRFHFCKFLKGATRRLVLHSKQIVSADPHPAPPFPEKKRFFNFKLARFHSTKISFLFKKDKSIF